MYLLVAIIYVSLGIALGYLWPWRGARVENPRRVPGADAEYTVLPIRGEVHAFTDEQLLVARQRADRLRLS